MLYTEGNKTISGRVKRESKIPDIPASKQSKKYDINNFLFPLITPCFSRSDVCFSRVEIVTPYWASNSNGRVRAILNNKEFEQAIHQEICR